MVRVDAYVDGIDGPIDLDESLRTLKRMIESELIKQGLDPADAELRVMLGSFAGTGGGVNPSPARERANDVAAKVWRAQDWIVTKK